MSEQPTSKHDPVDAPGGAAQQAPTPARVQEPQAPVQAPDAQAPVEPSTAQAHQGRPARVEPAPEPAVQAAPPEPAVQETAPEPAQAAPPEPAAQAAPPEPAAQAAPPEPAVQEAAPESAVQETAPQGEAPDAAAPSEPAPRPAAPGEGLSPALVDLAHAYGVATEFWDWQGEHSSVPRSTLVAVLGALEVDATTDAAVEQALAEVRDRPWRRVLPDVVVTRAGSTPRVPVHVDHGAAVELWVELEGGGRRRLAQEDRWVDPRVVDGRMVGEANFLLPADLPLGWHRLVAVLAPARADGGTERTAAAGQGRGTGEGDAAPTPTQTPDQPSGSTSDETSDETSGRTSGRTSTQTVAETPDPGRAEGTGPARDGDGPVRTVNGATTQDAVGPTPPADGGPELAGPDAVRVERPLVVTPARLELPAALRERRAWGFMTQLYSVRSQLSWGLGDLADLAELADWSARDLGAGFVLVNPLHAAEPVAPMEPSPYLPTTRRFVNPVYLRVEDIREVAYMSSTERALVEWQAESMRARNTDPGELDRDAVWEAKRAALETVFVQPRSRAREAAFEAFCRREGVGLVDFATWCALAERYGLPMTSWPEHARDPHSESVAQLREELADRVEFHMWLQWCLDEQLDRAQRTALDAGMSVGIVHDLAVGVHPVGADAWGLSDVLAHHVTVGAPPDAFNQQGQDWSQPPWRPDRLAELGYAPYRDMLRTVLRHAGGVRVDHIIGLFRLWWVPSGLGPAKGTYVRYDHEALIGILALEAHRAGAFVVGEDLGTVEPWARDYLRERGILGTSILWFEKNWDTGKPLPPQQWRELCLATVTTHDLPPTSGYLAGEHIELRQRLGLLTRTVEEEIEADTREREEVLDQLRSLGLLSPQGTERDQVEALHRFLTWTPARLLGVALADAVGDRRAMNQPGTNDEYPNWRLPLADGVGRPVLLEEIATSIRASSLARTVNGR